MVIVVGNVLFKFFPANPGAGTAKMESYTPSVHMKDLKT